MAKSYYDGYVGISKSGGVVIGKTTKQDRGRGAKQAFDKDYEGMKTSYETYKRSGDPSSDQVSKGLGRANEEAARVVQAANDAADSEKVRERNRAFAAGERRMTTDSHKY